jgi:excisionase family DNA binding protein
MSGPGQRLLDYPSAAAYLGVPIGTLRSMVSRKQVPHIRLTARVVRFDLAELDAMIEARRVTIGGGK